MNFLQLSEPFQIGKLISKNKIIMPAMHLGHTVDGKPTIVEQDFYSQRAAAGIGIIVVGMCGTDNPADGQLTNALRLNSDEHIKPMERLMTAIKKHGTLAGIQLSPLAGYNNPAWHPQIENLKQIAGDIGLAASRAQKAGANFVELMLSGGSLLSHFLSPAHNTWELPTFSGSLENRMRMPLMALAAIKKECGDFTVMVRIHGHEFLENGYNLSGAAQIARVLEKAGVDAIDVTAAGHRTKLPQITRQRPTGTFSYIAANIVDAVNIPVFFGGRIRTHDEAESMLEQTGITAVTVGRALIADSGWAGNIGNAVSQNLVECTACCHCLDQAFSNQPVTCALHPTGANLNLSKKSNRPSQTKNNRVLIAGGGPAGLEAAFEFANAGFEVTIHEQGSVLGGRAGKVKNISGHHDLSGAILGLISRLKNLGVVMLTDTAVTKQSATLFAPDILVMAVGARPRTVDIPGIDTHGNVLHVQDILDGAPVRGKNIAIVGGNAAGVAMALHLAKGRYADMETLGYLLRYGNEQWAKEALNFKPARNVTVLKRRGFAGKGLGRSVRWALVMEMELFGVRLLDRITYKNVTADGLALLDGRTKKKIFVPADAIVLATGYQSNPEIVNTFKECAPTVVAAGDVIEVGNIKSALASAHNLFTSI